jgi:hypothetical protein
MAGTMLVIGMEIASLVTGSVLGLVIFTPLLALCILLMLDRAFRA